LPLSQEIRWTVTETSVVFPDMPANFSGIPQPTISAPDVMPIEDPRPLPPFPPFPFNESLAFDVDSAMRNPSGMADWDSSAGSFVEAMKKVEGLSMVGEPELKPSVAIPIQVSFDGDPPEEEADALKAELKVRVSLAMENASATVFVVDEPAGSEEISRRAYHARRLLQSERRWLALIRSEGTGQGGAVEEAAQALIGSPKTLHGLQAISQKVKGLSSSTAEVAACVSVKLYVPLADGVDREKIRGDLQRLMQDGPVTHAAGLMDKGTSLVVLRIEEAPAEARNASGSEEANGTDVRLWGATPPPEPTPSWNILPEKPVVFPQGSNPSIEALESEEGEGGEGGAVTMIAGVAAGTSVAVIGTAVVAALLFRRRRQQKTLSDLQRIGLAEKVAPAPL